MTAEQASGFGVLLKHYRRAAGLTQEALAERAALSVRGLQDLERGVSRSPRRDTVDLLAAALGLSPEERAALLAAARPSPERSPPAPPQPHSPAPPQPLLPARPARAGPSSGRLIPLVGRRHELALLEGFLAGGEDSSWAAPAPPVLLLAGEPGIGKTRLLQAAAQGAVAGAGVC